MNLLIGIGLADIEAPEEPTLRARIRELVAEQGFSEYFDPMTGAPAGGKSFSWTAAAWLRWAQYDA